jgi:phosphoglycerate dehydrogenase-like enzyme
LKILLRFAVDDQRLSAWRQRFPGVDFVACHDGNIPPEHCDAHVICGGWELDEATVASLPNLQWVQATFTGVESFLAAGLAGRGIALTNFRGVSAPNIAEHVLACMLAFARGLPELMRRQTRHEWRPYGEEPPTFELQGQRLGLIGMGEIAREVAARAKRGFDMEIWGLRRNADLPLPANFDRVLASHALDELLSACDHIVLAPALTFETRGMIDAGRLAAMKDTARLYNVGRGELVDQDALVEALRTGRIAGAALDVTFPEPLPADSPLWDMENVIITAHTAGPTSRYWDRGYAIFADNIERFRAGEPLINLVDQRLGY